MNPMEIMSMLPQLRSNPIAFLTQRGLNIPSNLNDPNSILNHLMQTNQISQAQVNQAYQWMQRMGGK